MEKEEAVKLLKLNGYNAIMDKGVPTVIIETRNDKIFNTVAKLLRENGYKSSFGVKGSSNSMSLAKETIKNEIQEEAS